MSYDISLLDQTTREVLHTDEPHAIAGGTYRVGGTTEAWLNVTYNYSKHFRRVLGENGIRSIYGKTGEQSLPVLRAAIEQLKTDESEDYWLPTEGNARAALVSLCKLAELFPQGVWDGD